ncbi:uncharacterized protein P884DRAFT_329802, partial [Thermothelomyces heterothallicus CBS 202.75]|uniref:uncharacterized protein n=1 Tax=Thermothelomyces heterothallicus CBS 202.75 TaxID=1149848 RepID=UPI0037427B14
AFRNETTLILSILGAFVKLLAAIQAWVAAANLRATARRQLRTRSRREIYS